MITNIIKLNYSDTLQAINLYKKEFSKDPVLLINSQTFEILKKEHEKIIEPNIYKIQSIPQLFGCYISIADWLSFGEVDIR